MRDSPRPKEYAYTTERGALLHRRLLPFVLAVLPALVSLVAFLALPRQGQEPAWLPLTSVAIVFSWLAGWTIWSTNAWAHARRGRLGVDRRGVFLDDTLVVPADQIASAALAKLGGTRSVVRLRIHGRGLTRYLEGVDPQRVVTALGLDAAHARSSYVLPWRLFRWNFFQAYYMFLFFAVSPVSLLLGLFASRPQRGEMAPAGVVTALTFAIAVSAAFWALWARSRLHVTFGTDGLWMKQWGRERIVRWADVASIDAWSGPLVRGMRAAPEGFDLVLRDGERLPFYTARERTRLGLYDGDVVATRLREAMAAASDAGAGRQERLALPPRGDLSASEWIEDLRRAADGERADFRTATMDPDELWRAVEDPAAAPLERAAAATALGSRDSAARDRLRIAAAAVASPKLRVAFEAAAEKNDPDLAKALGELEAENENENENRGSSNSRRRRHADDE